jgi:hypothetical protein
MKRCPQCDRIKPLEEFSRDNRSKDGRQSTCKECKRNADNRHYAENPDRRKSIRSSVNEQRDLRLQHLNQYKKRYGCVDCGEKDPVVLDFDHVKGSKKDNISSMAMNGLSWEAIFAEIEKCEVVCANDHRRRTYARRKGTCGGAPHS